ncbi:polysaccharide biosynthesis/export family protein [Pontibacter sp. G13]|uniref:polysaccharide biosynthesis/export family protein n=1 Tax=Pontibacter sp. G13 TaxID=3074898 RepID=UPI00288B0B66|nr:polysaccharide biosynthesis/export family protein [Pontibacter sp. G13]WNJ19320.1 polysaccharide biosynthesis/export family protein [Pontibacter sp. G13]
MRSNNHAGRLINDLRWWMIGLALLVNSCTTQRLFQDRETDTPVVVSPDLDVSKEHVLKEDDKITVSIWGHDELGVGSAFSTNKSTLAEGKYITIDHRGEVSLPLIGTIKLAGLTVREANLYLDRLYAKYIKSPIVYLRVLNHFVTVMGEVNTPGNYQIRREQQSLVQVIGQAGGFTKYALKNQIKVIRNYNTPEMEEIVVDLTDVRTLEASGLLMQSGDILYIPERRTKRLEESLSGIVVPIVGILASAALIISLTRPSN